MSNCEISKPVPAARVNNAVTTIELGLPLKIALSSGVLDVFSLLNHDALLLAGTQTGGVIYNRMADNVPARIQLYFARGNFSQLGGFNSGSVATNWVGQLVATLSNYRQVSGSQGAFWRRLINWKAVR